MKLLPKGLPERGPAARRTAIVSTYAFIRDGEVEDTFRIAELLVQDEHELIQKAVGSWVRTAGPKNKAMLLRFLKKHRPTMPRVALRYAVEKLDAKSRAHFMKRMDQRVRQK